MKKKYTHLAIGFIIIGVSLFIAFKGVSLAGLLKILSSVKYIYLLPALLLILLSFVLRAVRWRYLLRPVKEVSTGRIYSPMMIGFMANMLPARAGEFIRAYLLSKREMLSFSASLATIVMERLFDLGLVMLMLVVVLVFMPEVLVAGEAGRPDLLAQFKVFGLLSGALFLAIVLFSFLLQFKNELAMRIAGFVVSPLPRAWRRKVLDLVASVAQGMSIVRDKNGLLVCSGLSALIWGLLVVSNYPLYLAFDIQTSMPVASSLLVLCVTVTIFITVAPTPGFLGSYHLACVAALHGIFGIQKATALSFGLLSWLVVIGPAVVIGALYAMKEHLTFSDISGDGQ